MNNNRYMLAVFLLLFMALSPLTAMTDDSIRLGSLNIMRHAEPKIPLKAWLYMDKRFRNFTFSWKKSQKIEIGEGLSRGTEEALMEIFNEVVVINAEKPLKEIFNESVIINIKPDISKKNDEVIIKPEIVDVFWISSDIEDSQVYLFCKWTIFDTKGKVLYVNTINAIGKDNSSFRSTRERKAMTQAVEDLYKKLLTQMYSSKWWMYIR
ncbi:MAG: hypothetical protein HY034_07975 [Nitrospirae bacterium]|nr:hypothetical protein [Nitrospirota bacterium]